MKQCVYGFILLLLQFTSFSQTQTIVASFIDPYPIEVTFNKTTNLLFPYAIKSVDRGSPDILVQKAKYIDTILQLKAGKQNFSETNLSVVTTDGKLYSFTVHYEPSPARLNYCFATTGVGKVQNFLSETPSKFISPVDNEEDFLRNSKLIIKNKKFIHGVKSGQYKMLLQLDGVYIKNDHIYFLLQKFI